MIKERGNGKCTILVKMFKEVFGRIENPKNGGNYKSRTSETYINNEFIETQLKTKES
jgi:hypothetical protein